MGIFDAVLSFLVAICIAFTNYMDYGTATTTPEIELVKEQKLVFHDAAFSGQGVTTDGEYFYTSGSITAIKLAGLTKWDADTMEVVSRNTDAIPDYCKKLYQSDHIGGISYYNGKIYAAIENKPRDFPLIITYDAETLEPIDIYKMGTEHLKTGLPWCAVDKENKLLYCSDFNDVNEIFAYNIDTMEYSHSIKLSREITRLQGGEVYGGTLYLSYDVANSNTEEVLTVDVNTGKVGVLAKRTLPSVMGNEAEGMTVHPMADGSLYHILDYDKSVGVYIRHYAPV